MEDDDTNASICEMCHQKLDGMECLLKFHYPCGYDHQFHDLCLLNWDHPSCPICRSSFEFLHWRLDVMKDYLDYLKLNQYLKARTSFQEADPAFKTWVHKNLDYYYRLVNHFPPTVEKLSMHAKRWDDESLATLLEQYAENDTLMQTHLKHFRSRSYTLRLRRGLKRKLDDDDDHNRSICSICLDALDGMHCMLKFYYPCGSHHQFHDVCLVGWMRRSRRFSCPVCRENFEGQGMLMFLFFKTSEYCDYLTLTQFLEQSSTPSKRFKRWAQEMLDGRYKYVKNYPRTVAHLERYGKTWNANEFAIFLVQQCDWRNEDFFSNIDWVEPLNKWVRSNHACWEYCNAQNCFFERVTGPTTSLFESESDYDYDDDDSETDDDYDSEDEERVVNWLLDE